jgi:hypothetical protein
MENKVLLGVVVLAAVSGLALVSMQSQPQAVEEGHAKVCFGDKCIDAEIAQTTEERSKGLMFREELPQGRGMLFVFPEEGNYSFWMKNTLIPLTIVWVNNELEIVHIENAVPCESKVCKSYKPDAEARYVVEVNPIFAEGNIKLGDRITIDFFS